MKQPSLRSLCLLSLLILVFALGSSFGQDLPPTHVPKADSNSSEGVKSDSEPPISEPPDMSEFAPEPPSPSEFVSEPPFVAQSEEPPPSPRRIPRPPRRRLPPDEPAGEILQRHRENAQARTQRTQLKRPLTRSSGIERSPITGKNIEKLDFVDEPIVDVLRAIATAYGLSIIPDQGIDDLRVTIHLEDVPVVEGLQKLVASRGLELVEDGNIYRVRVASETAISAMEMQAKRMNLDVENQPVKDFIKDFVRKTSINVVAQQGLEGSVTGHLTNVLPINGFKAIMEANNFKVRVKNGIYLVEAPEERDGTPGPGLQHRRRFSTRSSSFDIDVLDGKVNLSLTEAPLVDAVRQIAELSGLNVVIYGDVTGTVNAELRDVSVDNALVALLKGTKYTYTTRDNTLLIGDRNPNTPQGEALSDVDLHFLRYVKAENVEKLIPKALKAEVTVIKEQNALLILGTQDVIEKTGKFLSQVDLPVPQVMMEVVVVEYLRDRTSQFGIKPGQAPGDLKAEANIELVGSNSVYRDGNFQASIGIRPQNFFLHLDALEVQNKAKVLAMPKVTTINGNKANLKVTRTQYVARSDLTREGQIVRDFRAFDDGITIDLTPWVTQHGEVNVEIQPTIKTATGGQGADSPPDITDRSVNTIVRLLDGQTLALGGLIDTKETTLRQHVPLLGSIPILGYLFSWRQKRRTTTELVIYVTPRVIGPEYLGVDLERELEMLDNRGGFVRDKDYLGEGPEDRSRPASEGRDSTDPSSTTESVLHPEKSLEEGGETVPQDTTSEAAGDTSPGSQPTGAPSSR